MTDEPKDEVRVGYDPQQYATDGVGEVVDKTTGKQLGGATGKGFMPGVSGNPAGRPKGTKSLTTLLVEALRGTSKNGKTWEQNLIEQVMNQAIVKGDMRAIEHIWDRTEGKPEQGHVVTGNLTINFDPTFGETNDAATSSTTEHSQE